MDEEMIHVGHPDRQRMQDERNRVMTELLRLVEANPPVVDWLEELRFRQLMLMPPTRWQVFKARLRWRIEAARQWLCRRIGCCE
jgi:hypothetical protein